MSEEAKRLLCNIAHTGYESINVDLTVEMDYARLLHTKESTSHQLYREDHMTITLGAALVRNYQQHVQMQLFTPQEEKANGADWYWRFDVGDIPIHARVQAKRIRRFAYNTPDQDCDIFFDLDQLKTLIEVTSADSQLLRGLQSWVAVYGRFEADPPCGVSNLNKCKAHRHRGNCSNSTPSLWIASATEVRKRGIRKMAMRDFISLAVRLDCLLPCMLDSMSRVALEEKGLEFNADISSFNRCESILRTNPYVRENLAGMLRISEKAIES